MGMELLKDAEPVVFHEGGKVMTDSRNLALVFGKAHRHVLRDIGLIVTQSPDLKGSWFREVGAPHPTIRGRMDPVINMTRDGFTLIAMGFTGAKALQFKLAYIRRFNEMEAELVAKPVKVRAHRRALPSPAPAPASNQDAYGAPFGLDIAREMYRAIMSANVRVERGQAPDFGSALEAVFSDIVTQLYGGDPVMGKILLGAPMHRARAKWAVPLSS